MSEYRTCGAAGALIGYLVDFPHGSDRFEFGGPPHPAHLIPGARAFQHRGWSIWGPPNGEWRHPLTTQSSDTTPTTIRMLGYCSFQGIRGHSAPRSDTITLPFNVAGALVAAGAAEYFVPVAP